MPVSGCSPVDANSTDLSHEGHMELLCQLLCPFWEPKNVEVLPKKSSVQQEHLLVLRVSLAVSTSIPPGPSMTTGATISASRLDVCVVPRSRTAQNPKAALLQWAGPAGQGPWPGPLQGHGRGRAGKRRAQGQQPAGLSLRLVLQDIAVQILVVQDIAVWILELQDIAVQIAGSRAAGGPFFAQGFVCRR